MDVSWSSCRGLWVTRTLRASNNAGPQQEEGRGRSSSFLQVAVALCCFGLVNVFLQETQETLSCHLAHILLLSASSAEDTELLIGSLQNDS